MLGANERIDRGVIGCGGRGRFIVENMVAPANVNMTVAAVNDIWKHRMETYPDQLAERFGGKPRPYADYRGLLNDQEVALPLAWSGQQPTAVYRSNTFASKIGKVRNSMLIPAGGTVTLRVE